MASHRDSKTSPGLEYFLQDNNEPRSIIRMALQSTIPSLDELIGMGHRHGTGESNVRATTSVGVQGSGVTPHNSLPGLTQSTGSGADRSVSSSVGYDQILRQQHILSTDSNNGDILVANPRPWNTYILECPFSFLNCHFKFHSGDVRDWLRHSLTHFIIDGQAIVPPTSNRCCFCFQEFHQTDEDEDEYECWSRRMEHVKFHYEHGHRLAHARPDFGLMRYLWEQGVIDLTTYRDLLGGNGGNGSELTENFSDDASQSVISLSQSEESSEPVACLNERRRRPRR